MNQVSKSHLTALILPPSSEVRLSELLDSFAELIHHESASRGTIDETESKEDDPPKRFLL